MPTEHHNRIIITGAASGVGQALSHVFNQANWQVQAYTRDTLDLDDIAAVIDHTLPTADVLVHCAAHDLGGKTEFLNHDAAAWTRIINTNLTSVMLLTQKMLRNNVNAKIVLVTSTNNNRYWPNDLVYSLTKQALTIFRQMLAVDHPSCQCVEVRLGLTRTSFNRNRYRLEPDRAQEIYHNPCLEAADVAQRMFYAIQDPTVKQLEIAP